MSLDLNKIRVFVSKVKRFLSTLKLDKKHKGIIFYFRYFIIIGAWLTTFFLAYLLYIFHDLPSIDAIAEPYQHGNKVTMLDNQGDVLAVYGDMHGKHVNYYEIPRDLINAVIATEDRKFFDHFGIDISGIIRATAANFRAGRTVQGGSTITQQLAKIMFLTSERKLTRKFKEAFLALEIERKYSKQQIITTYLNRAYMGSGIFGISAAAKYYFAKNVQDLNLYESALLAGLLKSPSRFSPNNNKDLSGSRAYQILLNMHEANFISNDQLKEATNSSVILDTKLMGSIRRDYFTNWVYDQIYDYVSSEDSGDIIVKTTFDKSIHSIAKSAFTREMKTIKEKRNANEGAVIIMDYNGNILSMIGGTDFSRSSFNRATQASRPSGSVFKTIVYTSAMENGFSPDNKIEDKPIKYDDWEPQNFHKNFLGEITLEEGFRKSLNTISIQLMEKVGVSKVIKTARKLGIESHIDYNLASALGSSSNTLLEITKAHGIIANNGLFLDTQSIDYIVNRKNDEPIYKKSNIIEKRVISADATEKMQFLLRRAVIDGSARKAASSFKVSGKTGTSQDFRDAWFIGYTDKHIIGVWIGNDDYSPTKYITGGTFPTIIARNILRQIHKHKLDT
ncbi:MAG: PBP1A family penicillin-binding protein [Alphaproteobacteria bacterium]|nr:PBP1A family penicillin-binding protein [Alphaproteobacteria bacterium]